VTDLGTSEGDQHWHLVTLAHLTKNLGNLKPWHMTNLGASEGIEPQNLKG
jgi:hypothetical protein